MYRDGFSNSRHGCINIPINPVRTPPRANVISRGNALAKSLAGDTTLAAMLTDSVATTTVNIAMATTIGWRNSPTSKTGSQMALPKMIVVAEVIMTPMAANTVIVVGSATTWP